MEKRTIKIFLIFLLAAAMCFGVRTVSEAKTTEITMAAGSKTKLRVRGVAKKKVKWSVKKKSIASISKKGVVKAKKAGKTVVIAKVGKKKYRCKIKVLQISKKKLTLSEGKTYKLSIKGTKKAIRWSSSKISVAWINGKGQVHAEKAGSAVITARVSGIELTCRVTVKKSTANKKQDSKKEDSVNKNKTFTVSFDCNADESETKYQPESQTVSFGKTAQCPSYPTRKGYIFDAWYTDKLCTKKYDFKTAVYADTVLYAGWFDQDAKEAQLTEEEYQTYLNSSDKIAELSGKYEDSSGYVKESNTKNALDAVENYVKQLLSDGTITYYSREDGHIYVEFASGIIYIYKPWVQGYDSGGTNVDVVVVEPFSDEVDSDGVKRGTKATECVEKIQSALDGSIVWSGWYNADANLKALSDLYNGEDFLWHGHGGYDTKLGSYLVTGEQATNVGFLESVNYLWKRSQKSILCCSAGWENGNRTGDYYGVTADFFENVDWKINGGMAYLAACRSGQTDSLANAFENLGAEVVFVNRGSKDINTGYDQTMMKYITGYMSAEEDGIFHTAYQALKLAQKKYGSVTHEGVWVDYVGEGDFTLCAGVKATVKFSENLSSENISKARENLIVKLTDDYGFTEGESTLSSDNTCYFNQLEEGTYYASLYDKYGNLVSEKKKVQVKKHRFTDVELEAFASIQGIVREKSEDESSSSPISGVSVTLSVDGNELKTVKTDENGNYKFTEVPLGYCELSFSCGSAYNTEEFKFTLYEPGTMYLVENIYLKKEKSIPSNAVYWNGNYYALYDLGMTWDEAVIYCQNLGGHLAAVTSAEEESFIDNIVSNGQKNIYWLGGYATEDRTWHWVTGEDFSYTHWSQDQPDNNMSSGGETALMIYRKKLSYTGRVLYWNDLNVDGTCGTESFFGTDNLGFLCEWEEN